MKFIEQWLQISPDHGDGSLEIVIVALVFVSVLVALYLRLGPAAKMRFGARQPRLRVQGIITGRVP